MGAFDGTEVCEMVGIYILFLHISKCNNEGIGLYRDDGLVVFKNISDPLSGKIKKDFQAIFNENSLKIELKCNSQIVDYLDVTLNLTDGTHKPYRKPNDVSMYIHKKSNHPPNIIKQIPLSIEKRLSKLSSNKEIFDEAAKYYENHLTRNQNESLNNMLWTKCPKRLFTVSQHLLFLFARCSKNGMKVLQVEKLMENIGFHSSVISDIALCTYKGIRGEI